MEDAELLTGWQRTQAEFKQRRKLAGDLGAKEKLAKMKAFQDRLRSGSFASTSAAPAAKADTDSEAAHKEVIASCGLHVDVLIDFHSKLALSS